MGTIARTIANSIQTDGTLDSDASNSVNFRNIVINGDMSIAQRGTSSTSTGFIVDRFNFRVSNTDQFAYTHSQSTTVPTGQGFSNSWKLDVTTAETTLDSDEAVAFQTRLEAQNLQSLKFGTASAETLTLSFWVRSNKTGTYGIYLRQHDAGKNYVASYTISSADTWEKKTISISGNTADTIANDNGIGFWINWTLAAGSSLDGATMDSWHTAATEIAPTGQVDITDSTSNEWYITGVQLEVGTTASDFEFLPYDVNFQRCQRYYHQIGYGLNGAANEANIGQGQWYNSSEVVSTVYFPTSMRTAPSMTSPTVSGGYRYHSAGSYVDVNDGGSINRPSNMMTGIVKNGLSGGSGGQASFINARLSGASYKFDAEL